MAFTKNWDESKPAGGDNISRGDDEIRDFKTAIRERLAVEHQFYSDETGKTDVGEHSTGSARIYSGLDADKPTSPKLNQVYYATDTYKLYVCKEAGSWTEITAQFSVNNANNADKVDNKDASDFFQKAETGEINALTEKTTLSDNDIVLIEDSEDSYAKKKVKKSSLTPIISEITISSNCDYVDFTGLDSDIDGGYILESAIVNNSGATCYYSLYVNGDTTAGNYSYQRLYADGTTIGAGRANASYIAITVAGDYINVFTDIKVINGLFRYISTASEQSTAPGVCGEMLWGRKASTITKITSLRVSASATNGIGAGSKFILKRIRG